MRFLLRISLPHEKFNAAVRNGTAGQTMGRILEETRPEAVYFTEMEGRRTAIMIVDVADASRVPAFAEPWFLQFDADVEFHIVMSGEELERAGLEDLGRKWGRA